jgi:uncharacterized protein YdiU (UPF0061 family)
MRHERHFLQFVMIALATKTGINSFCVGVNKCSRRGLSTRVQMSQNIQEFGLSTENSFLKYLNQENADGLKQHSPRQIYKSHYTTVKPEAVPSPYMVAASESCAKALGLNPSEFRTPLFIKGFTGNEVIPGLDAAYCSNYGCHCYSSWFGQLGDGRAMALGEVLGEDGERYELQLKGSGRSPYSR